MVFNSITFLLFFLLAVLGVYFAVPKRLRMVRNCVLLGFSLVFYAFGGAGYLALLLASILINYLCGLLIAAAKGEGLRRAAAAAAVLAGVGLIGWFKYAGFLARSVNALGLAIPVPEIALPIGISFFTFQGLSYVIDVYRGNVACQKNPLYVALYIALFPQLVAGPIVRYTTVEREIVARNESLQEFSDGLVRFLFGLGKKVLLANAIGEAADGIFALSAARLSTATAWIGAIAYTFQIYFDFSAYSDMAIGLGRMFGFHFLENFNYPYIADSVTAFWRRWHISLTTWFRDYLYVPLGGNRCGKWKHIRNLVIVWLLTGLWHGAAWNFVAWGAWFCVILIGEKFLWGELLTKLPKPVKHIYTMLLVTLSWVLFRSPTLADAGTYLAALFGRGEAGMAAADTVYYLRQYWAELALCLIGIFPIRDLLRERLERRGGERLGAAALTLAPKLAALALLTVSYARMVSSGFRPFIYFQF